MQNYDSEILLSPEHGSKIFGNKKELVVSSTYHFSNPTYIEQLTVYM